MFAVDGLTLARAAVDAAADKKADDVILLDLRETSPVADFFVVCSGSNERQIAAIADNIQEKLRVDHASKAYRVEGTGSSGWLLLDYGDVLVHIFAPSQREFYRLETLWAKAPVLVKMQ